MVDSIKNMNNRYVVIYFKNWDDKHPIGVIDQNIGEVGDLPSFYQYQLYCRSLNSSIQDFKKAALEKVKQAPEDEIVENMIKKVKIVPEGAQCANYAFDVTPAKYITKLITEKGIIDANSSSINKLKN